MTVLEKSFMESYENLCYAFGLVVDVNNDDCEWCLSPLERCEGIFATMWREIENADPES